MSSFVTLRLNQGQPTSSRSMGVKLIVVCGLALLMAIPAIFVGNLVDERTQRAREVANDIGSHVGGQQTFLGPTLAVPYTQPPQSPSGAAVHGIYLVFPAKADATVNTVTEERHRSLFKVPVFRADLKLDAEFDLTGVPTSLPSGAELDWNRAEIVVGVSDARGALADAVLTTDAGTSTLAPSAIAENFSINRDQNQSLKLTLFGTRAALAKADAKFHATSVLKFSGAERIAVLAYGKSTHLKAQGDWPNPGFDGGILPTSRSITNHGFTAEWTVPFIARSVRAEGPSDAVTGIDATALGISFVEMANSYQSVMRSLKYVLLFLGLLFLTYFVFEATTGKRVHPAQYVLVGMAQIIFYLLLLALTERIGFDVAFSLAGVATVLLLSANAGWIFASRLQGLRAFVVFTLLYVFIFFLLRLEDNALLVGALASFAVVAVVMYFTRTIDWYSSLGGTNPDQPTEVVPGS